MRLLGFRGRWIEPILSGQKTTTIRAASGQLPRVGEIVGMRCRYDQPPFAYGQIMSVRALDPRKLTKRQARADGHQSADSLRAALIELYGDQALVSIGFRLVTPPEVPTLF